MLCRSKKWWSKLIAKRAWRVRGRTGFQVLYTTRWQVQEENYQEMADGKV